MRSPKLLVPLIIGVLALATYLYRPGRAAGPPPAVSTTAMDDVTPVARPPAPAATSASPPPPAPAQRAPRARLAVPAAPPVVNKTADSKPGPNQPARLHYVIDDGIAVVQGDVAVGVPTDPNAPATGLAELRPPAPWTGDQIAYFVQPGVDDPDRVRRAIQLFAGTKIRFIEFTNEADALVFEPTTGVCKSYLGKISGRQPIWIAPDCGPTEIAHEIMHALGFAHEQNRADRDEAVIVDFDNIDEQFKLNFEKLPASISKHSLSTPFDFTSIMMYPPWMFAKGGQSTMRPRHPDHQIAPGSVLSPSDEERLNGLPRR